METLNSILSTFANVITVGGVLYGAYGGIQLGLAIKDHQGPAIGPAIMQIAGAAAIILAGATIAGVQFGS